MVRVMIEPKFEGEDKGDGGIRRVVEAQRRWLPHYGVGLVDTLEQADVVAVHAGHWVNTRPVTGGGKPVVSHCHGLYWAEYQWDQWCDATNKDVIAGLRRADAVTAPSEWVADVMRRGMWLQPEVITHGIEPDEWPAPAAGNNDGYVLWNKTRVDPICDPSGLLSLAAAAPGTQFVGSVALDAAPSNYTASGRVSYEAAKQIVQRAGVYLCTSRETFGIGTLEAMAAGVPILGWAWGGQREFVKHEETGWLCNPGDFDGLVTGLRYCLEHRQRLGAAAREYALTQSWQDVMGKYANLYTQLAAQPQAHPSVTIVIPCYNLGRYLPDCISSIVKQQFDFNDLEILIVDDNSTDDSYEVADKLARSAPEFVRLLRTPENQYLAGALNFGISQARGHYIMCLDPDNMIGDPGTLSTLKLALDVTRENDIVYGRVQFITESGAVDISVGPGGQSSWPPSEFSFTQQIMHRNQIPSSAMYRKSVWARIGGYRRRCRTAEDADFWCRATRVGCVPRKATEAVTLVYRNRPDSMSRINKDWAWHLWYNGSDKVPMAAVQPAATVPVVPSYEPVKVSIVIPVGVGHEQYVLDAVDSLVAQTFDRGLWECIVVCDRGVDLPWIHPFCRVIKARGKAANRPAHCRNLGAKAARGQAVLWLDADDYLQPDALQKLYDTWREHGGYVYCDWRSAERNETKPCLDWKCGTVLQELVHPVTAMMGLQAWRDAGGFDTSIEGYEDWDFYIALEVAGYCGTRYPEPLMCYRLDSGTRRGTLSQDRETHRAEVQTKWQSYIKGPNEMPCGCQRGGGAVLTALQAQAQAMFDRGATVSGGSGGSSDVAAVPEMVMLAYVGKNVSVTYRGASGTQYRFGRDTEHRTKYVKTADAIEFLKRPEFKLANNSNVEAQLVAAGPPA